ncbi:putative DNA-binding protein [Macrococcus armenti]|uniref:putative DNA-binding protein n=1 Tax=Macrococcus armenti TaxID=2875764 RepID=UPI001CCC35A7|nr:putative DNA-binding protein [Macrococcus armenti]UBH09530.1 putative DNA-binding protein [Macrococcus armenti]UBH11808.1 putative DNA-binding protein [Macrococcus armenti]UBH16283.1 putative DNA-binding protein [Macrococcus armenti]UBH18641.1 putative DNA-binding protein [Macrococcus armenti]UBH20911.1 putative DNA-binding protein [Macrococcus armenti]
MNDLLKTMRMNYLFDFYQSLLTDKQRNYLEKYYMDDESLSEIAETFDVSRQAVYDNIRRTSELLEEYEAKLGLYKKFEERQAIYEKIMALNVLESDKQRITEYIEQLQRIE